MIVIILFVIPHVFAYVSSMQHHVYISRKSRSRTHPSESSYVYNQVRNNPGTLSAYHVSSSDAIRPVQESYSDINNHAPPTQYIHPIDVSSRFNTGSSALDSFPIHNIEYEIAKSEAKYDAAKMKTDTMYDKLRSAMYYQPTDTDVPFGNIDNDYRVDDDDIRTSSRGLYDSWPFYYHNPYEYESLKLDADINKAKDKRNTYHGTKVIPIHEDLSHDIPYNSYDTILTTPYFKEPTTDNPMTGHDPFFSFVLNDYYSKNIEDDPLVFKGLDWVKGVDDHSKTDDLNHYSKRNRRLPSAYYVPVATGHTIADVNNNEVKADNEHSVTEKGFARNSEYDKHEKGNSEKENHMSKYEQHGDQYKGFKDFAEAFANKFGAEDHKKDSKYILKKNQDKGENRKGFRRVYHKDEYQEDKEFYDNNNSNAKFEDKGSSTAHIGGSEAFLKSQANAVIDNNARAVDRSGDKATSRFENNHRGHDMVKGLEGQFINYRDVAKTAAHSNDADYSDYYRSR